MSDKAQMGHSTTMENDLMLVGVPNSDHIYYTRNEENNKINKQITNSTGMVICYQFKLGEWIRIQELILPLDELKPYAKFGSSVDISVGISSPTSSSTSSTVDDTNVTVAIVGAPGSSTAYVYQFLYDDNTITKGQWYLEEILKHEDASRKDHMFGATGAVAIDHHWAVVGASGSDRVFVWHRQEVKEVCPTNSSCLHEPEYIEQWGKYSQSERERASRIWKATVV